MSATAEAPTATQVTLVVERVDERPDFCGPGECHDGPWVRVEGVDVFCSYINAANDAEAYEALGRKIASLVLGDDVLYM